MTFQPVQPNAIFAICETLWQYNIYAIQYYYPCSRFSKSAIEQKMNDFRKAVWDFKSGRIAENVANVLSSAMINTFKNIVLNDYTLCIIPASTKYQTNKRFKCFCEYVSEYTGIVNGFNLIFREYDVGAKHLLGNLSSDDKFNSIGFSNAVKNKKIMLFDDIITTGDGFLQVADTLISFGAREVIGLFLGKTV